MRDHSRPWLRLAAVLLAASGILVLLYGGFLPSPILPEVGVVIPIVGRVTVFWGVLAGAYLVAAAGVATRRRWGRALAAVLSGGSLVVTLAGMLLALTRADLASVPGGLVGIGLDAVVLYAVARQWPRTTGRR